MKKLIRLIIGIAAIYYMVSNIRYAFTHPEKTRTQLFLETPKALMWQ